VIESAERMVLRAELLHDRRKIIGYTTALAASSVFVRTDEALDLGDSVTVRLSFPRLLAPLELEAQVVSKDPGAGHGYLAGVILGFPEQHEISALLADLEEPPDAARSCRIIVVEDSALVRDLVQLRAERFAGTMRVVVDTAPTAAEALAMLDQHAYDLALVDLYLVGEQSGADLVRALRTRDPSDLPVIGFSVGGAAAREEFLSAGADLFLDKPVVVHDVFATLERLLVLEARRNA
jgi:CheY-like chemotaxis protein/Tfp pilus assembly protein PilZ